MVAMLAIGSPATFLSARPAAAIAPANLASAPHPGSLGLLGVGSVDDFGSAYPSDIRRVEQQLISGARAHGLAGILAVCRKATCSPEIGTLLSQHGRVAQLIAVLTQTHPCHGNGQAGPSFIWPGFSFTGGGAPLDYRDQMAMGVGTPSRYRGVQLGIGNCDGPSYQRWCEINLSLAG
jgi:hypothetical protein